MLSQDMLYSSVAELSASLRNKQFTSVELTEAYLARLDRLGPQLNAVVTVTQEVALEQAHRADQEMAAGRIRGPLHGIPYGVKDLLATQGIRTTGGTRIFAQNVPDEDSTVVRRLREAGAVLVAKLAMVEEVMGEATATRARL